MPAAACVRSPGGRRAPAATGRRPPARRRRRWRLPALARASRRLARCAPAATGPRHAPAAGRLPASAATQPATRRSPLARAERGRGVERRRRKGRRGGGEGRGGEEDEIGSEGRRDRGESYIGLNRSEMGDKYLHRLVTLTGTKEAPLVCGADRRGSTARRTHEEEKVEPSVEDTAARRSSSLLSSSPTPTVAIAAAVAYTRRCRCRCQERGEERSEAA
ncbi:hypothetical protein [Oryza sativa Japonica Group]|uniref:Uncharacterized protein n=1 Tax=Oryza sativa subsp. japonica TaxID=39947 RepID=Q5QMC7_ORYSJ|nr:hypothetical protein [Oryza sativa Japonica Group]